MSQFLTSKKSLKGQIWICVGAIVGCYVLDGFLFAQGTFLASFLSLLDTLATVVLLVTGAQILIIETFVTILHNAPTTRDVNHNIYVESKNGE